MRIHGHACEGKFPRGLTAKLVKTFSRAYIINSLPMSASPFSSAHRLYVKSLYKRYLANELDWTVRRDVWRAKAVQIRAEFERNR
jgi:hypothetical protein